MRYAQVIRELFRKKVLREYKFLQIPLRTATQASTTVLFDPGLPGAENRHITLFPAGLHRGYACAVKNR